MVSDKKIRKRPSISDFSFIEEDSGSSGDDTRPTFLGSDLAYNMMKNSELFDLGVIQPRPSVEASDVAFAIMKSSALFGN